ncbi:GNAT family N-acetyltransferase [Radiobacillus deserti]|uniref:GNAT family N-acetyltransferase n=1 Tax=Radiobacillus deserti TaxID=2594883 RepID=UPI001E47518B|nr:GNAT family N-acetyltransferase [Radiobacillus deserti]
MAEIREVKQDDVLCITHLMGELGFPTTIEQMKIRLNTIQSHPDYQTFVAVRDRKVIGMIGLFTGLLFNKDGRCCRVISLVVDQAYRGEGIGKLLLIEAEKWAEQQGVIYILLNSGNQEGRRGAMNFINEWDMRMTVQAL